MLTTRNLSFSPEELDTIRWGRYHADCPIVRRRHEILWLRSLDQSIVQIAQLADCAENTVRSAMDLFLEGGIEAVERVEVNSPSSSLEPHRESLKKEFQQNPPRSVNEARLTVERLTGVSLKNDAIREFMYSMEMVYRKVGTVPSKADPKQQEEFKKKSLFLPWSQRKKAKDKSSSSTPPTSSSEAFWVFSGRLRDCLSPPVLVGRGGMCWGHWMSWE